MSAISNYLAKKLADHAIGNQGYTAPSGNLTLKLYSVSPGPTGGGTVITGGGYSDKTIANNTTNFPVMVLGSGEKFLNTEQSWTATADWGTVTSWALWDGSNLLFFGEFDTPIVVNNGDLFKIPAGSGGLKFTISGGISNYLAKKLLDHVLGNTAYAAEEDDLHLKLYTVAPNPTGGGTLVSAGGYSDATMANTNTIFPDMVLGSGQKFASVETSWTASADWGTVVAWSLYDNAGNLLVFAELDTPVTVQNGDIFKFVAGAGGLKVTLE